MDDYKLPDLKKKGKSLKINKWYKLKKKVLLDTIKQELASKKINRHNPINESRGVSISILFSVYLYDSSNLFGCFD